MKSNIWQYVAYTKISEINSSGSKYIFVEETDPRGRNVGAWEFNPKTPAMVDAIAVLHINAGILGFADGHGEKHKWVEKETIDMAKSGSFNLTNVNNRDLQYLR